MNNFPFKSAIACLFLFFISCSDSSVETENLDENGTNSDFEIEIMNLINQHRTNKGLTALSILEIIKSQTDHHSDYMIAKAELSHDDFNVRADYLRTNANATNIAENVANGYTTAQAVVNGWISSNGHRENIEGDFSHFNLTAKQHTNGVWYYTNIFIKVE